MRRRRWRTAVLWVGCALCVLIVVAFVASGWWLLAVQVPTRGPGAAVNGGMFSVYRGTQWGGSWHAEPRHQKQMSATPDWRWWNGWDVGDRFVVVPLYTMFLAAALPTLLVWRFVPKFPCGHCRRCGYNLKGLTEARCPECGTEFVVNRRNKKDGSIA